MESGLTRNHRPQRSWLRTLEKPLGEAHCSLLPPWFQITDTVHCSWQAGLFSGLRAAGGFSREPAPQEDTVKAKDQQPWGLLTVDMVGAPGCLLVFGLAVSCLMLMGLSHQISLQWVRTHLNFKAATSTTGPPGFQTPLMHNMDAVTETM